MTNERNDKTTNEMPQAPEPGSPVTSADDPRLTAYALGELEAGADVSAVERFLQETPGAQALVDETRAFSELLSHELAEEIAGEDAPRLQPEQRATLTAALDNGSAGAQPVRSTRRSRGAVLRMWLSTAAALLIVGFAWKFATDSRPLIGGAADAGHPTANAPSAQTLRSRNSNYGIEESERSRSAPGQQVLRELGYTRGAGLPTEALSQELIDSLSALGYSEGGGGGTSGGEKRSKSDEPLSSLSFAPAQQLTDGQKDELAALGYLGGGGGGTSGGPGARRDVQEPLKTLANGRDEQLARQRMPASLASDDRALRSLGYLSGESAERNRPISTGESYAPIHENPFKPLTDDAYSALSTFGIDVDTASYANARRFLNMKQAPPPNAVRLEEFINAFDYDLPAPTGEHPFSVTVESASAPWAPRHRLVRIGLKGASFEKEERPASNLVFLLDVSGSMKNDDKLPLLVASLKLLVEQLDERDRVAIVTYANGSRLVLPATSGADKDRILASLNGLTAGGSTHASDGIQKAYAIAQEHLVEGGVNRVLLATDGDFNVGLTQEGELEAFITEKAKSGVFLTVLGFGTGNLKDSKAEILADRGNGNYAYIDTLNEAHKVLVREMGGTLVTIAKDVKLQVEFNPSHVSSYRLLGYENRKLAAQDFRNDKKDAGEIGAGHTVTALYEVVPVGLAPLPGAVQLKYQASLVDEADADAVADRMANPEMLTVNLRYKRPNEDTGREFAVPFMDGELGFAEASTDFRFAASVASFGMVLRHSAHRGDVDLGQVYDWAAEALGADPHGDRAEFLRLVRTAQGMSGYQAR